MKPILLIDDEQPSISPHFCVPLPSIFTPFFPIRFVCMFYYPRLFTCITRLTHPHPGNRSHIAAVQPSHFVPSSSHVHTTSLPPFSPTERRNTFNPGALPSVLFFCDLYQMYSLTCSEFYSIVALAFLDVLL